MSNNNFENDFSPMCAIVYPIPGSDHYDEYRTLTTGNNDGKLIVFDNKDEALKFIANTGDPFLQRYALPVKVADYYPVDKLIHYSWIDSNLE